MNANLPMVAYPELACPELVEGVEGGERFHAEIAEVPMFGKIAVVFAHGEADFAYLAGQIATPLLLNTKAYLASSVLRSFLTADCADNADWHLGFYRFADSLPGLKK